ncbi:hypothetical protein SASPL_117592 [Salvia splendens]|uniref:Uncharacterized protein n=1 Tax=Salvia splendens TaxID=180675 RepID=A0A8X8XVS4_SALSN|nr:hypothetical protein SASPL_117592 [Salvia splendens]
MSQRLSLLYTTHILLRNASSPSFTYHVAVAPYPVAFSCYRDYSKMLAYASCVPCGNSLIGPHFVTTYPLMFRPYCTSEEFESIKPSYTDGTDHADEVYKTVLDYAKPEYKMEGALDELGIELTTPLVVEVLDRLRFEEKLAFRSGKSSVPIEVLLTILRRYIEKHLTHLQKFAKKKKIRMKTQPEINSLNLLLDAMCKCSLVEDAEAMCQRTKAMGVLENMISMGFTPEYFTYNTAIYTFCKAGMLKDAAEILQFMKTKGSTMSSPTAKTYAIIMVALVQNDRMDECFEILADMIASGCLHDVSTYKDLIDAMCSAGKIEAAYKFLEEMGQTSYPPDIVTYNCFLKVLIGEPDGAVEAWREMERRGCARDTDTYCVMIEGLFGCNNTKDAISLLEEVLNMGMKLPFKKFDSFLKELSAVGDLRAIGRLSGTILQRHAVSL